MAQKKPAKKPAQKKSSSLFSPEERAAMRELAQERKAAGRGGKEGDEMAVVEKIASMSASDRAMAERVHRIIRETAPELAPKLWYGMPAYARDGNVVCFFQGAQKFKARYSTLGFTDKARLDDGNSWPTAFAVMKLTSAEEAKIRALVKKAAG